MFICRIMMYGPMIILQSIIMITQPSTVSFAPKTDSGFCTYTEFCQHNIPARFNHSQADNCICFERCNYKLDDNSSSEVFRKNETTPTTCMLLTTASPQHMNMRSIDNMYKVVDRCPSMMSCAEFNQSAHWGSMYPVYSPVPDKIYLNELCAFCNQDFEVQKWDVEVNCEVTWMLNAFIIEGFKLAFDGIKEHERDCFFRFLPPKMVNPVKSLCYRLPVFSCTAKSSFTDEMNGLCATTHPMYIYEGDGHKNDINCYSCSELPKYISDALCGIKGVPRTTGVSLSFLLEMESFQSFSTVQEIVQSETSRCNVNEIAEAETGLCRQLRCPEGMIQKGAECTYISSEWTGGPFVIYLRLEPRTGNDKLDREALNQLYDYRGNFFKHHLQSWKQTLYYYLLTNESQMRYFVLKLWHKKHTFRPHNFFEQIRFALTKPWTLSIGRKQYVFNASMHKYAIYQFCNDSVDNILKSRSSIMPWRHNPFETCEAQVGPELLTTIRDQSDKPHNGEIGVTVFFLCKQVDLKPTEYVLQDDSTRMIYFNVTGHVLEEAEFRRVPNFDGTFRVSVCMSAFGDDFWELPNRGLIEGKLHSLIVYMCLFAGVFCSRYRHFKLN